MLVNGVTTNYRRYPNENTSFDLANVFLEKPAQDRGPFWFSNILNEILEYIEIWNEFTV